MSTSDATPTDVPKAAAAPAPAPAAGPASRPRLRLTDPVDGRAVEDRPESWGERPESDRDRLAHYLAARPPHHGQ